MHKTNALQEAPVGGGDAMEKALKPVSLPYPEPAMARDQSLTPDIVYSILVAEIAIQRGDPALAYSHYMYGASLSGDSRAAQQATRIATSMRDLDRALAAVERWISLAPNEQQARASGVLLYLQAEQYEPALEHLKALVEISRAAGQDGFMQAVAVTSRVESPQMGLRLMQGLAEAYPDELQAHYALALAAVEMRQYDVAEKEIRSLLRSYPDKTKIYILWSNVLYAQEDVAGAERALEEALADDPDNRLLLTAYARLLMESKKLDQAYEQFKRIERESPEDTDVLYALGILSIELQMLPEARDYLQRLIEGSGNKRLSEATYFMGRTYEAEGQAAEAISWYNKVSGGDYQLEAQTRIAGLLAESGEVSKARDLLRQLRASMPHNAETLFLIEGEILQELGMHEEVMALCDVALGRFSDNHNLLYLRALSAAFLERLEILEQDLGKILSQDPDNADALNALGYTLADQTERYQEALSYIEKALALKPDAPPILDSMGWVLYRLGNYEEALRYLRRAMAELPDPEIAAHLGEVLWVTGEQDEARKIWRDSLKQNPENKYLLKVLERFDL